MRAFPKSFCWHLPNPLGTNPPVAEDPLQELRHDSRNLSFQGPLSRITAREGAYQDWVAVLTLLDHLWRNLCDLEKINHTRENQTNPNPVQVSRSPLQISWKPLQASRNRLQVSRKPLQVSRKPFASFTKTVRKFHENRFAPFSQKNSLLQVSRNRLQVSRKPLQVSRKPFQVSWKPFCALHDNLFVGSVSVVRGSGDFGLGIGSVPADRCALRLITATHCFESFVEFGGHFAWLVTKAENAKTRRPFLAARKKLSFKTHKEGISATRGLAPGGLGKCRFWDAPTVVKFAEAEHPESAAVPWREVRHVGPFLSVFLSNASIRWIQRADWNLRLSCTRLRVPPVALHVSRYTCRSWFPGFYSVLQV